MTESIVKISGQELEHVTIYCSACGVGHTVDLAKPLGTQFAAGICTCGQSLPRDMKDALSWLFYLHESIARGLRVEFTVERP